jgi:Raf kinase inhibitor-like YbhB/YbcL family protein
MKKIIVLFVFLFSVSIFAQDFTLKSNELGGQATNSFFADSFGCTGKNLSPHLFWVNAPKETKSFAVTVYDPDAPTGSGFWHWVVYNIPPEVTQLAPDAGNNSLIKLPIGALPGLNDAGTYGFFGACPPVGHGLHKYEITVYALSSKLLLPKESSAAFIGFNLHFKTLAKSTIVIYGQR